MSTSRVRMAGTAYAIGGLLWLVLAVVVAVVFGGDPPTASGAFLPSQIVWIIVQVLLLFGFFGIYWSSGVGQGVFGTIAFGLGVLGHVAFVAGEIHSLFIGASSDLLAVGALVSAVGMTLTGIAVLVANQWHGWTRWMPFLAGLYPFLFMFPILFIYGEPNSYTIAIWGLVRFALGLAIRTQADAMPSATPPADVTLSQRSV